MKKLSTNQKIKRAMRDNERRIFKAIRRWNEQTGRGYWIGCAGFFRHASFNAYDRLEAKGKLRKWRGGVKAVGSAHF